MPLAQLIRQPSPPWKIELREDFDFDGRSTATDRPPFFESARPVPVEVEEVCGIASAVPFHRIAAVELSVRQEVARGQDLAGLERRSKGRDDLSRLGSAPRA